MENVSKDMKSFECSSPSELDRTFWGEQSLLSALLLHQQSTSRVSNDPMTDRSDTRLSMASLCLSSELISPSEAFSMNNSNSQETGNCHLAVPLLGKSSTPQDTLLGTGGSQHPVSSPQSALNQSPAAPCRTQHNPHVSHTHVQAFDKSVVPQWGREVNPMLRDHRHGELVLQGTRLQHVEGRLADEYRLSMLDGLHRAYCETATISCPLHLVQHWNLRIS
ncbi:hypothetical protein FQN60_009645 [Etheostoma spectabile]|uniref:Uncharacterized protein n=1 Tax=Etheostoma spectabile TaxID=54343 RepID=A0A5J5DJW6_9PERO|nr:hypothetical protein FQN60_009645 [Etheostoma spectabile]